MPGADRTDDSGGGAAMASLGGPPAADAPDEAMAACSLASCVCLREPRLRLPMTRLPPLQPATQVVRRRGAAAGWN